MALPRPTRRQKKSRYENHAADDARSQQGHGLFPETNRSITTV